MRFHNTTYNIMSDGSLSGITEDQDGTISGEMTVDPPLGGTGPITGTVSNTNINFVVTGTGGAYTGTVSAQGSLLSGTYSYSGGAYNGQQGTWQATAIPPALPALHHHVNKAKDTATFSFSDSGAASFQCSLVKVKRHAKKRAKPRYSACRSPKAYKHLARGSYEFFVQGRNSAGTAGSAATTKFTI